MDKKTVTHIAKLSRIEIDEQEIDIITPQLTSIFKYVDKLDEIDTDGVEPTYQVNGLTRVLRNDETKQYPKAENLLQSTEHTVEKNQIKVPKIM